MCTASVVKSAQGLDGADSSPQIVAIPVRKAPNIAAEVDGAAGKDTAWKDLRQEVRAVVVELLEGFVIVLVQLRVPDLKHRW